MQKSNFTVIYDTNVLFPPSLRDLLIRLAQKNVFRAKWSEDILSELKRNLLATAQEHADKNQSPMTLTESKIDYMTQKMGEAVSDCLVKEYKDIEKILMLPDHGDRHVLAAAIKAKAEVIVTWNLKDFPRETLSQYEIEVQTPDIFIAHIFDLDENSVITAIREQRMALKNPPYTVEELINSFRRNRLNALIENLKGRENLI